MASITGFAERAPRERIDEIIATCRETARRMPAYTWRRDFLQLAAEVEHLRRWQTKAIRYLKQSDQPGAESNWLEAIER